MDFFYPGHLRPHISQELVSIQQAWSHLASPFPRQVRIGKGGQGACSPGRKQIWQGYSEVTGSLCQDDKRADNCTEWSTRVIPRAQGSSLQTETCCATCRPAQAPCGQVLASPHPAPSIAGYCSAIQSCPTFCNLMDSSTPGFPVLHHLPELAQTHVLWVSDAIQPSHLVALFSFYHESFPASGSFPTSQHLGSQVKTTSGKKRATGSSKAHPPLGPCGQVPFITGDQHETRLLNSGYRMN